MLILLLLFIPIFGFIFRILLYIFRILFNSVLEFASVYYFTLFSSIDKFCVLYKLECLRIYMFDNHLVQTIVDYIYENMFEEFGVVTGEGVDVYQKYVNKYGKIHGMVTGFYVQSGKKWKEVEYINGLMNGEYKEWYENGNLYYHCFYKDGILDGICKIFSENGNLCWMITYKEGVRDGISEMFSATNGRKMEECNYKDDKKHGVSKSYDVENNAFVVYREYQEGNIIDTQVNYL